MIGAAFGIGFVAGPLIGGLIAKFGPRAPFWAAAGIAGANLLLGALVLPETVTDRIRRPFSWARANPLASFKAIDNLPGIRRLLALHFTYSFAMFVYPAVWAFYGKARFGWDAWMIGFSLTLYGISFAVSKTLLVGPATKRSWTRRAVHYGILSNATPDHQHGELQGVEGALTAIAAGLSPLIMRLIFSAFTSDVTSIHAPGAPFIVAALLMVGCIGILFAEKNNAASGGED